MRASEFALAQGLRDTRRTIEEWQADHWRVLRSWVALSLAIAIALLLGVYAVARLTPPDPTVTGGAASLPSLQRVGIMFRNLLVLALHGFACVAGFIAGSSLPLQAERHSGWWRTIHEKAGPLAIVFVICATAFSLFTQMFIIGGDASSIAARLGLPVGVLLVALAPHAVPELTALFLPLAAWILASRRNEWHKLLAATFVTVGLALPVLIVTAFGEVYATPQIIRALVGA